MNAALTRATAAAIVALAALTFAGDAGAAAPRSNNRYLLLNEAFYRDYPQVGSAVEELPQGSIEVSFEGETYFFASGVWYQESAPGYAVADPPTGILAPSLPAGYHTVRVGDTAYFYSTGIYYVAAPGGYEVTLAPLDSSPAPSNAETASPGMD
jgi:hypothetical protein